jgi:hypothetical protein
MSKGLERYKVVLRFLRDLTRPPTALETSSQFPVLRKTGRTFALLAAPRADAAVADIPKISGRVSASVPASG